MTRFFARLLAFILAVTFLAVALLLIIHVSPESTGGYVLIGILVVLAFLVPMMIYKSMMSKWKHDQQAEDIRVGAGLAMGAAVTRRRSEDSDDVDLI